MDSSAVLAIASWVMAELVRVLHSVSVMEAQAVVNSLSERRVPLIWESGRIKRVLNPSLSSRDQILVLLASCPGKAEIIQLTQWTEVKNLAHFKKTLRMLHKARFVELSENATRAELLPPGSIAASKMVAGHITNSLPLEAMKSEPAGLSSPCLMERDSLTKRVERRFRNCLYPRTVAFTNTGKLTAHTSAAG